MRMNKWFRHSLILLMLACLSMHKQDRTTKIVGLCQQNSLEQMDCKYGSFDNLLECQIEVDWVFLFYNSTNATQQSTFQYLIPGLSKQVFYAEKYHHQFSYPPVGIIDCYTSPSLCTEVSYEGLPIALYQTSQLQTFKYIGYVTLPGLISFIKSHDPKTSLLTQHYKPEGKLILENDLPQGQINKWLKSIETWINFDKNEPFQSQLSVSPDQNRQIYQNTQIYVDEKQKIGPHSQSIAKQITAKKVTNQAKGKAKQSSSEIGKKEASKNDKKSVKKIQQSQQKKKQSKLDFLGVVHKSTQVAVSFFAFLGLGGAVLSCISSVCYCFFFIFCGALYVLVS